MKRKKPALETIPDDEWQEFVKWWKSKYLNSPDKTSVVTFLRWRNECKSIASTVTE